MPKKLVGQVTPEEKNEILTLVERRNGLSKYYIMNRLFCLASFCIFYMSVISAQEADTIAARLCIDAENAYKGINGAFLNKEKALELYIQAAERNYIPAIHKVAGFYYRGEVVDKDLKERLVWLTKAAEMGDADAQNKVGVCYHDGDGTVQNTDKAVYWYVKAADQGNIYAMNNLRMLYSNKDNIEEALKWTRMGAEHGQIDCQYEIGNAYNNGEGLKMDKDQAAYWFKMAADNGHKNACNKLAVIYHDVKGDYAQALSYLNKAVELGSEDAFFNLGFMYEQGHGTEKDFAKAEAYYLKAVNKKGNNSARYRLGVMYYEGRDGVKKNKKKGELLLKEAANNGNEDAKKYLEEHKVKWTI